jgi:hypothetical protein
MSSELNLGFVGFGEAGFHLASGSRHAERHWAINRRKQ